MVPLGGTGQRPAGSTVRDVARYGARADPIAPGRYILPCTSAIGTIRTSTRETSRAGGSGRTRDLAGTAMSPPSDASPCIMGRIIHVGGGLRMIGRPPPAGD